MKQSAKAIMTISAMVFALGLANAPAADAAGFKLFGKSIELAYAPQDTIIDDRFEQFESEEDMHELNDAWLGMPAFSKEGKIIGFVEDAYLDENGDVAELLVSLSDYKIAVYVDGSDALLTDTNVAISLTKTEIALLERENGFKIARR